MAVVRAGGSPDLSGKAMGASRHMRLAGDGLTIAYLDVTT
jgi:hypothetical protein